MISDTPKSVPFRIPKKVVAPVSTIGIKRPNEDSFEPNKIAKFDLKEASPVDNRKIVINFNTDSMIINENAARVNRDKVLLETTWARDFQKNCSEIKKPNDIMNFIMQSDDFKKWSQVNRKIDPEAVEMTKTILRASNCDIDNGNICRQYKIVEEPLKNVEKVMKCEFRDVVKRVETAIELRAESLKLHLMAFNNFPDVKLFQTPMILEVFKNYNNHAHRIDAMKKLLETVRINEHNNKRYLNEISRMFKVDCY